MLENRIDWLHRSSARLVQLLKEPRNGPFWVAMRRECWIHLKRSLETWWHVIRHGNGKESPHD